MAKIKRNGAIAQSKDKKEWGITIQKEEVHHLGNFSKSPSLKLFCYEAKAEVAGPILPPKKERGLSVGIARVLLVPVQ